MTGGQGRRTPTMWKWCGKMSGSSLRADKPRGGWRRAHLSEMVFLLSDPTEKGRLLTLTWNLSPVSRFSTVTFMNVLDVMVCTGSASARQLSPKSALPALPRDARPMGSHAWRGACLWIALVPLRAPIVQEEACVAAAHRVACQVYAANVVLPLVTLRVHQRCVRWWGR